MARRWRDVVASLASDLGGADHMSEAQTALVRRSATLVVQCEMDEALMAGGQGFDEGKFLVRVNTLRRLLTTLGVQRTARDVTPSLSEYITDRKPRPRKRL